MNSSRGIRAYFAAHQLLSDDYQTHSDSFAGLRRLHLARPRPNWRAETLSQPALPRAADLQLNPERLDEGSVQPRSDLSHLLAARGKAPSQSPGSRHSNGAHAGEPDNAYDDTSAAPTKAKTRHPTEFADFYAQLQQLHRRHELSRKNGLVSREGAANRDQRS